MEDVLTTYEASSRAGFTTGYLRYLLEKGRVKGRLANLNKRKMIWLIEGSSLKKYLSRERKRGPKPKKK